MKKRRWLHLIYGICVSYFWSGYFDIFKNCSDYSFIILPYERHMCNYLGSMLYHIRERIRIIYLQSQGYTIEKNLTIPYQQHIFYHFSSPLGSLESFLNITTKESNTLSNHVKTPIQEEAQLSPKLEERNWMLNPENIGVDESISREDVWLSSS